MSINQVLEVVDYSHPHLYIFTVPEWSDSVFFSSLGQGPLEFGKLATKHEIWKSSHSENNTFRLKEVCLSYLINE